MAKRKRNLTAYAAVRERSGGICERCHSQRAVAHHHRRLRSQWGADSTLNLVHLCSDCHTAVHHDVEQAYKDGWLISAKHHGKEVFDAHGQDDPLPPDASGRGA